jgi:hypothetical protein
MFSKVFFDMNFSFICQIFVLDGYIIEISKWASILMDFMVFSFRSFKVISLYQLTTTFFNMDFDLVLRGFNIRD